MLLPFILCIQWGWEGARACESQAPLPMLLGRKEDGQRGQSQDPQAPWGRASGALGCPDRTGLCCMERKAWSLTYLRDTFGEERAHGHHPFRTLFPEGKSSLALVGRTCSFSMPAPMRRSRRHWDFLKVGSRRIKRAKWAPLPGFFQSSFSTERVCPLRFLNRFLGWDLAFSTATDSK